MFLREINKKDYEVLLDLDKKVYPTEKPVTSKVLDKWFSNNLEFGMVYENEGNILCLGIVIPLNKAGWEGLISGKLLESELNEKTIFDINRDNEIYLHLYHIEKLDEKIKDFYKIWIKDLGKLCSNLGVPVKGFSALCVTPAGIGLVYNKLNFRERSFINSEHILKKNGKLTIFEFETKKDLLEKLVEGYIYLNRCKMLVLYPNEPSIVWEFLH
jgi:hypothetical protein